MQPFTYNALPSRVIFGTGTLSQVAQEIKTLGCSKALILTTPRQVERGESIKASIGDLFVGLYANATMHTPTNVSDEAVKLAEKLGADCVVAIGGGSTIGLGKAVALRTDLPQIVIPTTYAGSEATPIVGQTEDGLKTTQKSLKVLPEVIIYDIALTLTLPLKITVTSGINAIAHAVEALYSKGSNPVTDLLAEQGMVSMVGALSKVVDDPKNGEARSHALFGAWVCGICLGTVEMSLHHRLCHVLGGTFNTAHSETHTVILPHVIAYNTPSAALATSKLARALGVSDAAQGLFDFSKSLGAPYSLKQLGLKEDDLGIVVDITLKSPQPNPVPLEKPKLLKLLRNAYEGNRPEYFV